MTRNGNRKFHPNAARSRKNSRFLAANIAHKRFRFMKWVLIPQLPAGQSQKDILQIGLTQGPAGIILTSRLNSAQPTAGAGYELDAIAAVVLGGTSLTGGRGWIFGTLVGALLIDAVRGLKGTIWRISAAPRRKATKKG